MWSVERDGASAVVVATLRKAVAPKLWPRLFATDEEAAEAPTLIDGPERAVPRSKAELLKDAKERVGAAFEEGGSKAKQHVIEGQKGAELVLRAEELPLLPVVFIRRCTDCVVTASAGCSVLKLQVEGCTRCRVVLEGKVLTETVEAWNCEGCHVVRAARARASPSRPAPPPCHRRARCGPRLASLCAALLPQDVDRAGRPLHRALPLVRVGWRV